MRVAIDHLRARFKEASDAKLTEWKEKNPLPVPPTDQEIRREFANHDFRVHLRRNCKCPQGRSLSRVMDAEDFALEEIVTPNCIAKYREQAVKYGKRKAAFEKQVKDRRMKDFERCAYARGNFVEIFDAFERWRPRV